MCLGRMIFSNLAIGLILTSKYLERGAYRGRTTSLVSDSCCRLQLWYRVWRGASRVDWQETLTVPRTARQIGSA